MRWSFNEIPALAKPRIRVCFVSLHAYPLFDSSARTAFGGSEVRAFLFSTALAQDPDFDVSCVVRDDGQPDRQLLHGVSVWRHSGYVPPMARAIVRPAVGGSEQAGGARRWTLANLKWYARFRLSHNLRWCFLKAGPLLQRLGRRIQICDYFVNPVDTLVYERIGADVYCVLGVSNLAGEVAAFCRSHGRQFVLFIADITNLDENYLPEARSVNAYGDRHCVCRYTIDNADLIVAQLRSQRELLQQRFGRPALVISNPISMEHSVSAPPYGQRRVALWIGRADAYKKMPALLLDLARACPDVQFVMIMNRHHDEVGCQIYRDRTDNVIIHEGMPYTQADELFAQAFALVSTSLSEGFPNTFLQAGKYSVPILSYLVDPDGFIERHRCGLVAHGDMGAMVRGLRALQADQNGGQIYSRNIHEYVRRRHNLEDRALQLKSALADMMLQS